MNILNGDKRWIRDGCVDLAISSCWEDQLNNRVFIFVHLYVKIYFAFMLYRKITMVTRGMFLIVDF